MCARTSPPGPEAYLADCGPEEFEQSGVVTATDTKSEKLVFAFESFAEEAGELTSDQLYSANGDGKEIMELSDPAFRYYDSAVSPDGSAVAATRCAIAGGECGVYLLDAEGENDRRLASTSLATGSGPHPAFSADGEEVFFYKDVPTGLHDDLRERQL